MPEEGVRKNKKGQSSERESNGRKRPCIKSENRHMDEVLGGTREGHIEVSHCQKGAFRSVPADSTHSGRSWSRCTVGPGRSDPAAACRSGPAP